MILEKLKKIELVKKAAHSMLGRKVLQYVEILIWGGRWRRNLTKKFLSFQYKSKFRHDWVLAKHPPHFSDYEYFEELFEKPFFYYTFVKGYFTADVLKKSDKLLDIGTGQGFFPSRFFSSKCKYIDAVDIEKSAIDYAKKYNYADNINFVQLDAINSAFPQKNYDVIIWDSAIGHFDSQTNKKMLNKILDHLDINGIFLGCEILGKKEGIDHLQFFEDLNQLGIMLKKYFKHVYLKELQYPLLHDHTFIRRQAFWRCCNSEAANKRFIGGWVKI